MLKFYARFEISDETGDPMTDRDMTLLHYSRIISLQKAAFSTFPNLGLFALAKIFSVNTRKSLHNRLFKLSICNLHRWKYLALGDLGHVTRMPEYRAANAGLRYDFQLMLECGFRVIG